EGVAGRGQEPPVVARWVEHELEDAEGLVVADLTGDRRRREGVLVLAARPDDELLDPRRVRVAGRIERREALVVMVVAGQGDVHVRGNEVTPDRRHLEGVAMFSRGPARL